jgi:hypothetical protein
MLFASHCQDLATKNVLTAFAACLRQCSTTQRTQRNDIRPNTQEGQIQKTLENEMIK